MTQARSRQGAQRPIPIAPPQGHADREAPLASAAGTGFDGLSVRQTMPGGGDVASMAGRRASSQPDGAPRKSEIILWSGGEIRAADAPSGNGPLSRRTPDDGPASAGTCDMPPAMARAGQLAHGSNGLPCMGHHPPGHAGRRARYPVRPCAAPDHRLGAAAVPEARLNRMRQILDAEVRP